MKKLFILSLVFFNTSIFLYAQSRVFQSIASGDWNNAAIWRVVGIIEPPVTGPLPSDNVIVSHNVTLDEALPYTHSGNLEIQDGGKLTFRNQFTFVGNQFIIRKGGTYTTLEPRNFANALTIGSSTPGAELSSLIIDGVMVLNNSSPSSLINNGLISISGFLQTYEDVVNNRTFSVTDQSLIDIGYTNSNAGSLILSEGSETQIDGEVNIGDDLILYGNAPESLCGEGTLSLNGNPESIVIFEDGATAANRCTSLSVQNDNGSLPIEIISFEIQKNTLHWEAIEDGIIGFEILYSKANKHWKSIESIESKGNGRNTYKHTIISQGYYKLKVLSHNEAPKYSNLTYYYGRDYVGFYPSVISSGESIQLTGVESIKNITLYNSKGGVLLTYLPQSGFLPINIHDGMYLIRITTDSGIKTSKLIVK